MAKKTNPLTRVDQEFLDWIGYVQDQEVKQDIRKVKNKSSKPSITKRVVNFFKANLKIEQKFIEAGGNLNGQN